MRIYSSVRACCGISVLRPCGLAVSPRDYPAWPRAARLGSFPADCGWSRREQYGTICPAASLMAACSGSAIAWKGLRTNRSNHGLPLPRPRGERQSRLRRLARGPAARDGARRFRRLRGQQAVEACADWHPALAIFDVQMPVLDAGLRGRQDHARRRRTAPADRLVHGHVARGTAPEVWRVGVRRQAEQPGPLRGDRRAASRARRALDEPRGDSPSGGEERA